MALCVELVSVCGATSVQIKIHSFSPNTIGQPGGFRFASLINHCNYDDRVVKYAKYWNVAKNDFLIESMKIFI